MDFTPIDLRTWPRGQMFYYFSKMAPTAYSLTASVDVTALRRTLKKENMKFFPAYLWLVTRNLCRQIEFKVAEREGVLGYYDALTPLYATFHEDDETISLLWTEYDPEFRVFYERYLDDQKRFRDGHGVLARPELPPENAYTVSCLPWVSFDHFAVHSLENKPYYFPSVEAGKFFERDGTWQMPLSLTCHHAATDGWHIKRFLDDLQRDMDAFEQYL